MHLHLKQRANVYLWQCGDKHALQPHTWAYNVAFPYSFRHLQRAFISQLFGAANNSRCQTANQTQIFTFHHNDRQHFVNPVDWRVCFNFFVVIELFNQAHIFAPIANFLGDVFGLDSQILLGILNGIVEMTHGCLDITTCGLSPATITVLCTGLITFGGLATMLQAYAFLQKIGIKIGFFLAQKITQTIFACVICALLLWILGF